MSSSLRCATAGWAPAPGATTPARDSVGWESKRETIYCLTRYVAREIFGHPCAAPQRVSTPYSAG